MPNPQGTECVAGFTRKLPFEVEAAKEATASILRSSCPTLKVYPFQLVGTSSTSHKVVLTTRYNPSTISSMEVQGQFGMTSTCGASMAREPVARSESLTRPRRQRPRAASSELSSPAGYVQIGRPDTGNFDAICFDFNQKSQVQPCVRNSAGDDPKHISPLRTMTVLSYGSAFSRCIAIRLVRRCTHDTSRPRHTGKTHCVNGKIWVGPPDGHALARA